MGWIKGILLIVAGTVLLSPFVLGGLLFAHFHSYYTVGLTVDARGYVVLTLLFIFGTASLVLGIKTLRARIP